MIQTRKIFERVGVTPAVSQFPLQQRQSVMHWLQIPIFEPLLFLARLAVRGKIFEPIHHTRLTVEMVKLSMLQVGAVRIRTLQISQSRKMLLVLLLLKEGLR